MYIVSLLDLAAVSSQPYCADYSHLVDFSHLLLPSAPELQLCSVHQHLCDLRLELGSAVHISHRILGLTLGCDENEGSRGFYLGLRSVLKC